jgi:hypothetical protein
VVLGVLVLGPPPSPRPRPNPGLFHRGGGGGVRVPMSGALLHPWWRG